MLLQLLYATPLTLVLWMCISLTAGGPLSEDTTTVGLPMKFVKSSMDTSRWNTAETNDANDEIVRATEPIRSSGSNGVNFYRLPPSPANLLKPDGFQFYTYNERGDMITRQMTMQEIQALIAGGGPGHSNAEIQGPQKVEDILTGGKKVIDVVEKVQNVLKSAMDKPLSALSGSHLTIPEKANVEWSNILPAILAGDKYGNKVDENNHVEEATLKPMSTLAVQNVSFSDPKEGNASGTVGSTVLENVTKGTVQNEETTGQTESDGTHAASSTVKFETATSPYTEKLMIPVAVVTTERNTEQVIVTQHTTHSYSFHTTTEVIPSLANVSGEHYSRGPEGVTTATNVDTGPTTITSSAESTGSSGTDTEFASATSNILLGETQGKPITDKDASIEEEYNVSSKTQTSSMSESNKLEPPSTMPSHRTTSSDSLVATFITETSTIGHDVVRKPTGTPPTQHFKPLPVESVVNSLSSAIGQVSEDHAPSVSAVSPDLESPHGDTDNGTRSNGTEIVTLPPTNERDEEKPSKANDTFGNPVQNSFAGTTSNVPIDEQQSSTESWTKSVSSVQSSLNRTETTTGMGPSGITITALNPSASSETNFTTNNWNFSKPVETIDSILRTVSTDAVATVTESVTIPTKLTEGFSINTLASALIAGFDAIDSDRTQISFNGTTTTQSSIEINSTVAGTALNNILSAVANDSTGNVDRTKEADSAKKNENRYTFTSTAKEDLTDSLTQFSNSVEEGSTLETTDRAAPLTRTSIGTSQSESERWSIAEHTTAKSSAAAAAAPVENTLNAGGNTLNSMEEDGAVNRNTEAISSWSTESVNLDATDKFGTAATVAVTPDSSAIPERNSQVISQNEDENSGTHGNDTAEISSAGHNQHRNETIESFDATRTYPNDTESTVASIISTEYDTTESSATKRGSTYETSEANGRITSTTHEINVTTNAPTGTEVLGGFDESENQVKENANERESITQQSNTNSTDTETNSHHVWQEISLQETKPTTPTRPASGSKESEEPLPSTATTETEVQLESGSATEPGSIVDLDASKGTGGLDSSTRNASTDIANFSQLCNELAMKFWIATNKGLSTGRSLALSPFGMISLLSMIFLGARGSTSDEMNEVLGLDNVATFNPHLVFQNITDTVSLARQQGIANAAFVRELFADKAKVRKLLPFYKEQAQQFYEGLVAEVNFATISDLVRRRTNLLVRKQTGGRIKDFAKSNAVTLRSPLAAISANVFQTDCNTSSASTTGRDGELYFAVSSAHRSRKLIPVPATVWRSNVLAGYEPSLDATAIALGGVERLVSTIFLLPGQQGHVAPGDTLDRLEQRLAKGAFRDGSWQKVLKVLIPRPGLEAQIPKFSHRSVVNATAALKRMGLDQLFSKKADFKGINGIGNRLFLSDVLQMNLFSTCGDESIANGRHHVEIYPAGPSLRNSRKFEHGRGPTDEGREYRENPSKWVTRAAERTEAKPRLKLDQPFLYFVRHNPTGIILHMGRFNPRLL